MRDLNVKVGNGKTGCSLGRGGLGEGNERGDRWEEWCEEQGMIIANT